MKAKKICSLGSVCGKDICCVYCSNNKCVERCTDNNSTCGFAMSKGKAAQKEKNLTVDKSMED